MVVGQERRSPSRAIPNNFGASQMTNPLALVKRVQTLIAQTDAPLAKLEEGLLEIECVMASNDGDLEELASPQKIEATAATPAGVMEKKLDDLDRRKNEVERRAEIALLIVGALEKRVTPQREAERADRRQAAYDEARERHNANWRRVKEFLDRICAEVRQVMRAYPESEMRIAGANCDLPRLPCSLWTRDRTSSDPKRVLRVAGHERRSLLRAVALRRPVPAPASASAQ
jgi:hypothetical protein